MVLYLVSPDYALRPGPTYEFALDREAIEADGCRVFFSSAVEVGQSTYRTVGTSRAVALASTAPTLEQARVRVVEAARSVPVLEWRADVGEERYLEGLSRLRRAARCSLLRRPAALKRRLTDSCKDGPMIVERSMHPQFLSNTFLVADGEGGPAFFVDAGGPVGPLIDAAEHLELSPTHVLLTHHHFDHVSDVGELRARWPDLEVLISDSERELLQAAAADGDTQGPALGSLEAGQALRFGALEVRPLHTPGHTRGMLSFLVGRPPQAAGAGPGSRAGRSTAPGGLAGEGLVVFTGDTLFKDSVGGVRAPGHTTYTDLRDSIMGTLMELPPETVIYPGHSEETSVAREWDSNAFIRVWRGLDTEGSRQCTALGQPATLVLLGADYDGGKKAWVRWEDGSDDIVPGSRVEGIV